MFSLLGLEILQFVLPLYLLNLTGSGTLYGAVVAAGFVPYMLLAPIGGVVADRTRKRGVMAALDALLACAMAAYLALADSPYLVGVTVAILMAAFAAQALYQPCVQSAIPHVVGAAHVPQAVAVANQVSMVTGIGGPVIGGLVFGFGGLAHSWRRRRRRSSSRARSRAVRARSLRAARHDGRPRRHGARRPRRGSALPALTPRHVVHHRGGDAREPFRGVVRQHRDALHRDRAPGAVQPAHGGRAGRPRRGRPRRRHAGGGAPRALRSAPRLLLLAAGGLGAVALVLALGLVPLAGFAAMLAGYLWTMACCMALSIALTSYLQTESPGTLVGKVMALTMMLANLATPAGQLVYGAAFDHVAPWAVALLSAIATALVAAFLARGPRRRGVR